MCARSGELNFRALLVRRIDLFGKAIDPWNHKEADEERRREGLPPVYFRRVRRLSQDQESQKRGHDLRAIPGCHCCSQPELPTKAPRI
jgi:hypothetical protein